MEMDTMRGQRMLDSAPDYYQYAEAYKEVQQTIADELDAQEVTDADVQQQLYIPTATWGLKYWEKTLEITTIESDEYDIRRSRVLSKWRGFGQFRADLIKNVCEAFTNGEVDVRIRVPQQEVIIIFVGSKGVPPNLQDLKTQVNNIVFATLGVEYKFTYLRWEELNANPKTWADIKALGLTWAEFETWNI